MKKIVVMGAAGFIGGHLVEALSGKGDRVISVDKKKPLYREVYSEDFILADLRDQYSVRDILTPDVDQVYQLAADMGGAGFVFTGDNDADIMHNSAQINLNVMDAAVRNRRMRVFYSSSACVYPQYNQTDADNPLCTEDSAYPADPESNYGWEKLFSERLYLAAEKNYGAQVRIARYHNIFGPYGTWDGGREKAVAALCRKVALCPDGGEIEIWGDGSQTRSFLYIDDCVAATIALMNGDFTGPFNVGSEEMITINQLAETVIAISGKRISIKNIPGPVGVRGRNSDNSLIRNQLGWDYQMSLKQGLEQTYSWINDRCKPT